MANRNIHLWITDEINPNENVVINNGCIEMKFIYVSQYEYDMIDSGEICVDDLDDYDNRVIYKSFQA